MADGCGVRLSPLATPSEALHGERAAQRGRRVHGHRGLRPGAERKKDKRKRLKVNSIKKRKKL